MNVQDIKIFGDHDENTLQQMRTVAQHEACVGAVLCGDRHLGCVS
jgi:hypothetical protein